MGHIFGKREKTHSNLFPSIAFPNYTKEYIIMATDICVRRLTKELKSLMKDPIKNPKVTVAADESNILEVHYVIEGSEKTPYAGGIYHGKLIFPKDYPLKPPSVIMITRNGRFQPNRRLCLSMSDFHPEVRNPFDLYSVSCWCKWFF